MIKKTHMTSLANMTCMLITFTRVWVIRLDNIDLPTGSANKTTARRRGQKWRTGERMMTRAEKSNHKWERNWERSTLYYINPYYSPTYGLTSVQVSYIGFLHISQGLRHTRHCCIPQAKLEIPKTLPKMPVDSSFYRVICPILGHRKIWFECWS